LTRTKLDYIILYLIIWILLKFPTRFCRFLDLEKDFVVILTFVTILPMIEIPFCINPSIKRMVCLMCPQFKLFLSMPLNYQNQIRLVSYKSIMCKIVNNFIQQIWHQQQKKNLYILQTWLDMCINLSFTIVRLKERNQSFPYLSFLFIQ
jgi:hypothetical protein